MRSGLRVGDPYLLESLRGARKELPDRRREGGLRGSPVVGRDLSVSTSASVSPGSNLGPAALISDGKADRVVARFVVLLTDQRMPSHLSLPGKLNLSSAVTPEGLYGWNGEL